MQRDSKESNRQIEFQFNTTFLYLFPIITKGIINRSVIFSNTFTLPLVENINILTVQHTCMLVFNNALKGFDDSPQTKSKDAARWIVVIFK